MTLVDLCLRRSRNAAGELVVRLGVPLLDAYLEFLAVRSRPNTVLAVGYDLQVFFAAVGKPPQRVSSADVLAFVAAQYTGGRLDRMQLTGGAGGVSARTVRRRLSSLSGLFGFLHARADVRANPVPRELPTRRERQRPATRALTAHGVVRLEQVARLSQGEVQALPGVGPYALRHLRAARDAAGLAFRDDPGVSPQASATPETSWTSVRKPPPKRAGRSRLP